MRLGIPFQGYRVVRALIIFAIRFTLNSIHYVFKYRIAPLKGYLDKSYEDLDLLKELTMTSTMSLSNKQ